MGRFFTQWAAVKSYLRDQIRCFLITVINTFNMAVFTQNMLFVFVLSLPWLASTAGQECKKTQLQKIARRKLRRAGLSKLQSSSSCSSFKSDKHLEETRTAPHRSLPRSPYSTNAAFWNNGFDSEKFLVQSEIYQRQWNVLHRRCLR